MKKEIKKEENMKVFGNSFCSKSFYPYLSNTDEVLMFYGGAGSGKSEFVGRKIFYRCMTEGNHEIMIVRKNIASLRDSIIPLMVSILEENGILFHTDGLSLSFKNKKREDNIILFCGMDRLGREVPTRDITGLWMEEATEFSKSDFLTLKSLLEYRGDNDSYKQLILTLNPNNDEGSKWIRKMFFYNKIAGVTIHHSTIDDNPIKSIRDRYKKFLEKVEDPSYKKMYLEGKW